MEAVTYIQTNWVEIVAIIGGAVTLFSLVAKLTPTPKDDKIAAKLVSVLDFLALNTSREKK